MAGKAAVFWALVYDVPLAEVRSLAKEEWSTAVPGLRGGIKW